MVFLSSAVSDALDRNNVSGDIGEGDSSERSCRNRKRILAVLPSSFLKTKGQLKCPISVG